VFPPFVVFVYVNPPPIDVKSGYAEEYEITTNPVIPLVPAPPCEPPDPPEPGVPLPPCEPATLLPPPPPPP